MKNALFIHLAFILPDNFYGSFEDALECYLAFRRSKGYPVREAEGSPEPSASVKMFRAECQQSFMDELAELEKTGKKSSMDYALAEFNADTGTWQRKKGS